MCDAGLQLQRPWPALARPDSVATVLRLATDEILMTCDGSYESESFARRSVSLVETLAPRQSGLLG